MMKRYTKAHKVWNFIKFRKLAQRHNLLRLSAGVVLCVFLLAQNGAIVSAITQNQHDSIGSGARYFNTELDGTILNEECSPLLVGGSGAEQTWNYFKSHGLSDAQTAGIMGNFAQEDTFNPKALQGGGESERVPLDGTTGYGIAQWTYITRQENLVKFADSTSRKVYDLDLQLDFARHEMTTSDIWNNLRSISGNDFTAIDKAARYFHSSFEQSADNESGIKQRVRSAIKYHKLYSGSDEAVDPTPDDPICSPSTDELPGNACKTGEIIGWTLDGECRMVSYDQSDPRWADVPYGDGLSPLSESGCGPTSLAMIGATLLRDPSITPETVGRKYGNEYHHCSGTCWSLFPRYASDTGLKYQFLNTSLSAAARVIKRGGFVVISVSAGHFTGNGHLMVIRAISPDGTTFYLADPAGDGRNGDSETRAFSADFLRSSGNMKGLWGFWK